MKTSSRAWWLIARRELAGGLSGFWIYLACLALGAWAIAASGSTAATFSRGLELQSRFLLGGDAQLNLSQREATAEEIAWMNGRAAALSQTVSIDMMGRRNDIVRQVDMRGVDSAFPLVGTGVLAPQAALVDVLAFRDGAWGAAVSQSLLDEFGAAIGERIELGGEPVEIRAKLVAEPDRLGQPGAFQPSALVSLDALRDWDALAPGQFFRVSYRMILRPEAAATFADEAEADLGPAGVRYRAPEDAVDGLRRLLDMLSSFMTVIGVAALAAGGVGVSQATSAFLSTRMESIAALKALGADGGVIRAAYACQLGVLAALGATAGVVAGALTPFALAAFAGDRIPLPAVLGVYPVALVRAFLLAMLAAIVFAAPVLGRARACPPAALFRNLADSDARKTPREETVVAGAALVALIVLATVGADRPLVVLGLLAGAAVSYALLAGVAIGVKRMARWFAARARGFARLAFANLGGPGSLAPQIVPALGLGMALLTLVTVVQANLLSQIRETAPANAPALIVRQIPADQLLAFDRLMADGGVRTEDPDAYRRAPFLLARLLTRNGQPVDETNTPPEERWVIRGEVPVTYAAARPPEAELRSGRWWDDDYQGPLLVSVEEGVAQGLSLRVGDRLGFRIFGRELEAEIASVRRVDWGGFGANAAFVFSPRGLEEARPFHTAIVKIEPEREEALLLDVANAFPRTLVFQLRRTLETAADLFDQVALIVTLLASVVTVAGVLVLFGAFAAAARRRRTEAALLKTFGAERMAVLGLYAAEFALAGFLAAVVGALIGTSAAHPIVIEVFEADWRFAWAETLAAGAAAVASSAAGGAAVGWATLSHRPAHVLRSC